MNRAPGEVDDDFADFVRARQHQLLRAAHLVCGDARAAETLVERAFITLALHWRRVKDDSPDTFVRSNLYRGAISMRHSGSHDLGVLDRLSSKQRAITVLRHFEHRSEREIAEIVGISVGSARSQAHLGDGLAGLLADAAEPVAERDFVEVARRGAAARRHRRRRVGLRTTAALGAVAAAFVVIPRGDDRGSALPAPEPTSSRTTGSDWNSGSFDVFSVSAQVGPRPDQIDQLPEVTAIMRNQLALPEVIDFKAATDLPELSDVGGNSAPVRAVLLRRTAEGMFAVLVRPTLRASPLVLVDSLSLQPNRSEDGNSSEPLEVTAIARDRRHVMFLQLGKVLVLDALTGEVKSFPIADKHLDSGGWTPDGTALIVWSQTNRWRITPETGVVRRLAATSYPGRHQIQVHSSDAMRVLGFDDRGVSNESRTGPPVLGSVWGETFTSPTEGVATGGFLSDAAARQVADVRGGGPFQGVFTTGTNEVQRARLLVAPGDDGESIGCCEVLGWAYNDWVLIRWNRVHLLAWHVPTGALTRVSTLPDSRDASLTGSAAATVALAP